MLSCRRPSGASLPWLELVVDDLAWLFLCTPELQKLGCPRVLGNRGAWCSLARDLPAVWAEFLAKFSPVTGSLDEALAFKTKPSSATAGAPPPLVASAVAHKCDLCAASFASSRALATHKRALHKQRTRVREYVDTFARCAALLLRFALGALPTSRRKGCAANATLVATVLWPTSSCGSVSSR